MCFEFPHFVFLLLLPVLYIFLQLFRRFFLFFFFFFRIRLSPRIVIAPVFHQLFRELSIRRPKLFSFQAFFATLLPSTFLILKQRLTPSHFPGNAGCFQWACELWPPSDAGECCHPDLICHPFDDHPELFFVIPLLTNGKSHFSFPSRPHSSSNFRSLSLSPWSNNKSGVSPSPQPTISLSRFQILSSMLSNTARIDLKKQDLGVFILQ